MALGEEGTLPFLQHYVTTMPRYPVGCTHDVLRPTNVTACFSAGTRDNGKAMGVRKDTILRAANEFAHRADRVSTNSTKIRVHQLMKLASCHNIEEFKQCLARIDDPSLALLHLCGHGICTEARPMACVNPEHLIWGTQETNVKHIAAHEVLKLAQTAEEYAFLLTLYQRNVDFVGLF